jgi:hypothetical protein
LNDVDSIISQLEKQRDAIDRALAALREVEGGSAPAKRRGRPPAQKKSVAKRVLSPEGRAKISEAAKRRWADLKKSAKKATRKSAKKAAAKKGVTNPEQPV